MKTAITIEARMGSTPAFRARSSCRSLGRPLLERMIERLRRVRRGADVDRDRHDRPNPADDPIVALADSIGVASYRGQRARRGSRGSSTRLARSTPTSSSRRRPIAR